MLTGKNVVIVKGDKSTPAVVKEYDRVYLEFGPVDALESFTKTSDGKELAIEGKVWTGSRPAPKTSATPVNELVEQALAYFQAEYPKENPYHSFLGAASYGADLWRRNKIQADIRPAKPVDRSASITKMAKMLVALNPKMSMEKAIAVATAASSEE